MPLAPLQFIDSESASIRFEADIDISVEVFGLPGGAYPSAEFSIFVNKGVMPCLFVDNSTDIQQKYTCSFFTSIDVAYSDIVALTDDGHISGVEILFSPSAGNDWISGTILDFRATFSTTGESDWIEDSGFVIEESEDWILDCSKPLNTSIHWS